MFALRRTHGLECLACLPTFLHDCLSAFQPSVQKSRDEASLGRAGRMWLYQRWDCHRLGSWRSAWRWTSLQQVCLALWLVARYVRGCIYGTGSFADCVSSVADYGDFVAAPQIVPSLSIGQSRTNLGIGLCLGLRSQLDSREVDKQNSTLVR